MLVLSQFAGSATDLSAALIVNPYDKNEVVAAIKKGLEMGKEERVKRIKSMAKVLEEKNVYQWALSFFENAISAKV
jgi:trehalose 6-phosphate synthase